MHAWLGSFLIYFYTFDIFNYYSYVYGKPVKGEVVVAAYPTIHSSYIQPVFTGISRKTVPIDGVVDVEFDLTKELG